MYNDYEISVRKWITIIQWKLKGKKFVLRVTKSGVAETTARLRCLKGMAFASKTRESCGLETGRRLFLKLCQNFWREDSMELSSEAT